MNSISPST